jgi:hypothetical protein
LAILVELYSALNADGIGVKQILNIYETYFRNGGRQR